MLDPASLPPLERASGAPSAPDAARVLRRLLDRNHVGPSLDPWLAFPQKMCSFAFGPDRGPVPIGALLLLWSAGAPYAQRCPACGDTARMISFGGLLSIGGGQLVCPGCSALWKQPLGGLASVASWLHQSPLIGTPFCPTGMRFGAPYPSDGAALRQALGDVRPGERLGAWMGDVGVPPVGFIMPGGSSFSMDLEFFPKDNVFRPVPTAGGDEDRRQAPRAGRDGPDTPHDPS